MILFALVVNALFVAVEIADELKMLGHRLAVTVMA
jgi:hypothetical protein